MLHLSTKKFRFEKLIAIAPRPEGLLPKAMPGHIFIAVMFPLFAEALQ